MAISSNLPPSTGSSSSAPSTSDTSEAAPASEAATSEAPAESSEAPAATPPAEAASLSGEHEAEPNSDTPNFDFAAKPDGETPKQASAEGTPTSEKSPAAEQPPADAKAAETPKEGDAKAAAETPGSRPPSEGTQQAQADAKAKEQDARDKARADLDKSLGDKSLRRGQNGEQVGALQKALNEKLGTNLKADGKFGKGTSDAVKQFQKQNGLPADGVLGPKTREKLLGAKGGADAAKPGADPSKPATAADPGDKLIFGDKLSPEEQQKVRDVAKRLGAKPNDLMAVMATETDGSLSPSKRAYGSKNGAVGLIQFTGTAIKDMNKRYAAAGEDLISKKGLAKMSFNDQMGHVENYLSHMLKTRGAGENVSRNDLYSAVFAPTGVGKSDEASLYRRGTSAYRANRSLDMDGNGRITRGELGSRVDDWYQRGLNGLQNT